MRTSKKCFKHQNGNCMKQFSSTEFRQPSLTALLSGCENLNKTWQFTSSNKKNWRGIPSVDAARKV